MSRIENAKRSIVWGIIQRVASLLLPFLTRTVFIYSLGMEYVGLGSLFQSLLQVLSFAELGIGSALVFCMYEPMAKKDKTKVCALLNFYRKCYVVIGGITIACGVIILPFVTFFIKGNVPPTINVYVLFVIYLLNNAVGYLLFSYKQSLFIADQRVDIINKITLVFNIVTAVAQIVLLITFKNYYLYVLVFLVVTIATNISIAMLAKKTYPEYECTGTISKDDIRSITKKVGGIVFQKIGNIILTSADTIVISAFLGLKVLGVYNGYFYVVTALMSMMSIIQQSLIPSVGNSVVKESKEKNLQDFHKFHFMYLWIVSWCCTCLICLYQPFIELWQGKENMLTFDIVICLAIYFFSYKMGDMSYVYKEAIGLWWQGKFVPIISSFVNLFLNILLVSYIGLPGIIISTIVSASLINTPFGTWVLFHYYFESKKLWFNFLKSIFASFLKCVIACACTYFLCILFDGTVILNLALRTAICVVVPNVVLLVLNLRNPQLKPMFRFVKQFLVKKS